MRESRRSRWFPLPLLALLALPVIWAALLSIALVLVAGGVLGVLALSFLMRPRLGAKDAEGDAQTITLERDDYRRLPPGELPPR